MWYCIKIAKNKAKKVNKNNALVAQLDRVLYYELRCRFHLGVYLPLPGMTQRVPKPLVWAPHVQNKVATAKML